MTEAAVVADPVAAPADSKFMEPEGTPTFLGMTAPEWEAFTYGLKDGAKFWKRTHIKYSEVDNLDISPGLKQSIKDEWHYYEIGSDLPEDIILLGVLIYLVATGQLGGLVKLAISYFGIVI